MSKENTKPLDVSQYDLGPAPWSLDEGREHVRDADGGLVLSTVQYDQFVDIDLDMVRDMPLLLAELERWRELGKDVNELIVGLSTLKFYRENKTSSMRSQLMRSKIRICALLPSAKGGE